MPTQDYWGNFQVTAEQLTPIQILKEQANALSKKTERRIRASVTTSALSDTTRISPLTSGLSALSETDLTNALSKDTDRKFRSTLSVIVPSLDDYRLDIVTIIYPLGEYYPLILSDDLDDGAERGGGVSCRNELIFRAKLRQILSSTRTTDTLNSLLALVA